MQEKLTKEESELYLRYVKNGNMDDMFDFGFIIGGRRELEFIAEYLFKKGVAINKEKVIEELKGANSNELKFTNNGRVDLLPIEDPYRFQIIERIKLEKEYEKRNEEVVNKLISGELTIREALRELNKMLGMTLVKLSEIKK